MKGVRAGESKTLTRRVRRRVNGWLKANGFASDEARAAVLAWVDDEPAWPGDSDGAGALAGWTGARVERWAKAHGVERDVALGALLDFAIANLDSREGVPAWALEDLHRAIHGVQGEIARLARHIDHQARALDTLGSLLAGVPYVLIHWCAQDEEIEHAFPGAEDLDKKQLEQRLRETFGRYSAEVWAGLVLGALEDLRPPEAAPDDGQGEDDGRLDWTGGEDSEDEERENA